LVGGDGIGIQDRIPEDSMRKSVGEKKKPCKNCEGKGTLKKGDKVVRCQRCGGTGIKPS
jgi:DnaJ-class molecular chaperone